MDQRLIVIIHVMYTDVNSEGARPPRGHSPIPPLATCLESTWNHNVCRNKPCSVQLSYAGAS